MRITKFDNRFAVIIPQYIIDNLGLKEGSTLRLYAQGKNLIISKTEKEYVWEILSKTYTEEQLEYAK